MELEISDHKPVSAQFQVACTSVVLDSKRGVYNDVIRMLDRWENDSVPKVELNSDTVNFGPVRYMVEASKSVRLSNTSQVSALIALKKQKCSFTWRCFSFLVGHRTLAFHE